MGNDLTKDANKNVADNNNATAVFDEPQPPKTENGKIIPKASTSSGSSGKKKSSDGDKTPNGPPAAASTSSTPEQRSSMTTTTATKESAAKTTAKQQQQRKQENKKIDLNIKQQQEQVENPAKVKMGKANPIRDIFILLGIVCGLLICARPFNMVRDASHANRRKRKSPKQILNDLKNGIKEMALSKIENRRQGPCSLFVSTSSIPSTGLTLFAGRKYRKNETIIDSIEYYPLVLLANGNNNNESSSSSSSSSSMQKMMVPTYSLLLKHHPALYNVEVVVGDLADNNNNNDGEKSETTQVLLLRTTRPIMEGEELFVQYDRNNLHGRRGNSYYFDQIPTLDDYAMAADIIYDVGTVLHNLPKRQKTHGPKIVQLLQRTISKLQHPSTTIASLIPSKPSAIFQLENDDDPSRMLVHNKTLDRLQLSATCLDDISVVVARQETTTTTTVVAKRAFRKGQILATIPLYAVVVLPEEEEGEVLSCAAAGQKEEEITTTAGVAGSSSSSGTNAVFRRRKQDYSNCYRHPSLMAGLRLCPLLHTKTITRIEMVTDENDANVQLRWKGSTTKQVGKKIQKDDLVHNKVQLALEVVAMKPIESEAKLKVRSMSDSTISNSDAPTERRLLLPDELIPDEWKTSSSSSSSSSTT